MSRWCVSIVSVSLSGEQRRHGCDTRVTHDHSQWSEEPWQCTSVVHGTRPAFCEYFLLVWTGEWMAALRFVGFNRSPFTLNQGVVMIASNSPFLILSHILLTGQHPDYIQRKHSLYVEAGFWHRWLADDSVNGNTRYRYIILRQQWVVTENQNDI